MSRTIIKTQTAGWYLDAADPTGSKVRKQPGDEVISQAEFDQRQLDAEDAVAVEPTPEPAKTNGNRQPKSKEDVPVTVGPTGKMLVGPTTTIRCCWIDPENRTKKQQKMFDGPTRSLDYDKLVAASDPDNPASMPDGEERIVKVQDAFQVRFCVRNQRKHRAEVRRQKAAAKRAARQKTAA